MVLSETDGNREAEENNILYQSGILYSFGKPRSQFLVPNFLIGEHLFIQCRVFPFLASVCETLFFTV